MKSIAYLPKAFKKYQEWINIDRRTALKIGDLIKDILRNPFEVIEK